MISNSLKSNKYFLLVFNDQFASNFSELFIMSLMCSEKNLLLHNFQTGHHKISKVQKEKKEGKYTLFKVFKERPRPDFSTHCFTHCIGMHICIEVKVSRTSCPVKVKNHTHLLFFATFLHKSVRNIGRNKFRNQTKIWKRIEQCFVLLLSFSITSWVRHKLISIFSLVQLAEF